MASVTGWNSQLLRTPKSIMDKMQCSGVSFCV